MKAVTADRVIRAIQDDDHDYARYLVANAKADNLRELVLELAGMAPILQANVALVDVFKKTAKTFHVPVEDVLSRNQRAEFVKPRQIACYAANLLGYSQSHIARQIGRDHTTVWHAVTRVGEVPAMRNAAHDIANELGWRHGEEQEAS